MDVCSTLVFPLTFIPGVGDVVGTVGDWLCLVPAIFAVEHTGAFHGSKGSNYWQPTLALVLKKVWETVLDTPTVIVVAVGFAVAAGAGGATALFASDAIPKGVIAAGVFGTTLGLYLVLRGAKDAVGDLIFEGVYGFLTPELEGEALVAHQHDEFLQPGISGPVGGFGLIATVSGSKPRFQWAHAVPVMGPIWRADEHADNITMRVARYGKETLGEDKKDLSGVADTAHLLANVQGYSYAGAHVALGTAIVLFGTGTALTLTDENNNQQALGETLGVAGLVAAGVGGVGIVVGLSADRLQSVFVPAAYALAE
jgi:hypothetical protein